MARVYGWPVGLGREDLICVPAMIAFGFTPASDQKAVMRKLLCNVTLSRDMDTAKIESDSMFVLDKAPDKGIYLAPLAKSATRTRHNNHLRESGPNNATDSGMGLHERVSYQRKFRW